MSLPKFNDNINIIQALPDEVVEQASQLKAKFDEAGGKIKAYLNETLTNAVDNLVATEKVSLQSSINQTATSLTRYHYQKKIITDEEGTNEVTIPCNYKVGTNVLEVYLNGEKLLKSSDDIGTDGHYCEIGNNNTVSNRIKATTDWQLKAGDVLELIVTGNY